MEYLTGGGYLQTTDDGFLTISTSLTNEVGFALNRSHRREVVGCAIVVGQTEFYGANGAGQCVDDLVGSIHKVGTLGRRTGPAGGVATRAALAKYQLKAVVGAGGKALHPLAASLFVGALQGDNNLLALPHGCNTQACQVAFVLGSIPRHNDVVGATLGNFGVEAATHCKGREVLLQSHPFRGLQVGLATAHAGIEICIHCEVVHSVGNLLGQNNVGVDGRSLIVVGGNGVALGIFGGGEKLKLILLNAFHYLPRELHVCTLGGNHVCFELQRRERTIELDGVDNLALFGSTTHRCQCCRSKQCNVSEYLFHILILFKGISVCLCYLPPSASLPA